MADIFDLVLVSAFTGLGVAVGQTFFKLWIEPHIQNIHKKLNGRRKEG